MDEKILQALKERYEVLPKEVQQAIMSSNYQNTLIELAKKHNLNVEQAGVLERETTMVLFGVIKTSEYSAELTRELNIGGERANKIVTDVNERIFRPIRESLKLMFEEELPTDQRSDLKTPQGPTLTKGSTSGLDQRLNLGDSKGSTLGTGPRVIMPQTIPEKKIDLAAKLVEDKLTSAFKIPKIESDHTLGGRDPYREAIE